MNILDFLMENDIVIKSTYTGNCMTADEAFELGGEFVVYDEHSQVDLYRGTDFEEAMKYVIGKL